MSVDVSKLVASSEIAGLQNLGVITGSGTISGTMPAAGILPSSSISLNFPGGVPTDVIAMTRVNITGNGTGSGITDYWFPLQGSLVILDGTNGYFLVIYSTSATGGRKIFVELVNNTQASQTVSGLKVSIFMHLYSYPFAAS